MLYNVETINFYLWKLIIVVNLLWVGINGWGSSVQKLVLVIAVWLAAFDVSKEFFENRISKALFLYLRCSVIIVTLVAVNLSTASALMIGASKVSSHIGEPLSVSVPISNFTSVENVNVRVSVDSTSIISYKNLTATLVENNGNRDAAVEVRTLQPINEPYFVFSLKLIDGQYNAEKDFTVLLDLRQRNSDTIKPLSLPVTPKRKTIDTLKASNVSQEMGPYDWAKPGDEPIRFGAVLDGQSLWRVARRINNAFDVSVEQVMIALYDANPDAFYTTSINSLKAGSYLSIPDETTIKHFSQNQAKARLDALSENAINTASSTTVKDLNNDKNNNIKPLPKNKPAIDLQNKPTDLIASKDVRKEGSESTNSDNNDQFVNEANITSSRLIDDESVVMEEPFKVDSGNNASISVLAGTVDSLVKELIKKDQRIDFLEQKIEDYERLVLLDKKSSDRPLDEYQDLLNASLVNDYQTNSVAEVQKSVAEVQKNVVEDPESASDNIADQSSNHNSENQSRYRLLLIIVMLLTMLVSLRKYIFVLWDKLSSWKDNASPIVFDRKPTQDFDVAYHGEQVSSEGDSVSTDTSTVYANESSDEVPEEHNSDSDKTTKEDEIEFTRSDNEIESDAILYDQDDSLMDVEYLDADNEVDLEIEDRFSFHLANKNFEFIEMLLDILKDEGIPQETYDYLNLKFLRESEQEEQFTSFLEDVNDRMPSYSEVTKNKIINMLESWH